MNITKEDILKDLLITPSPSGSEQAIINKVSNLLKDYVDEYSIDNNGDLNRVNMNLTFEVKFVMDSDKYIIDDITADIKGYLEDINEINDLHMPNLITFITNKYRNRLVYFKFLDLNGYGPVEQSIYREDINEFVEATTVPEFLNVDTTADNEPNIKYIIKA